MTAVFGYKKGMQGENGVILCAREYMNSLEESSMEEVKQAIRSVPWLASYYEIGEKYIRSTDGRINYAFAGLRHNLDSLKSKANIFLCWIDEAEGVSEMAYAKLLPTIRADKSEVWITWNPESESSATDKRFRRSSPDNSVGCEMNWQDNPWFPDVLNQERLADQGRLDPNTYSWIWEGAYLVNSDRQVLAGKIKVQEFQPTQVFGEPLQGMDFGFAKDPTTLVRCYVYDDRLWIYLEAGKVGLDIDKTAAYLKDKIPFVERYLTRADNARPETISYLKRHGMDKVIAVKKWKGSVEDGVMHLRSYKEIVVHPQCQGVLKESRLYSYKVDKEGNITTDIVDDHNHYIDAIRYALTPYIKRKKGKRARIPRSQQ
jgi:phage terminase large subunit